MPHDPAARLRAADSLPGLAPGAGRYLAPPAVGGAVALAVAPPVGLALLALAGFVAYFFRDPDRVTPEGAVVCPADGRVSVVREEVVDGADDADGDPDGADDDGHSETGRVRVGVFMNVTDVHVVRAPADATVERVIHSPGAHRPAFTKESERNERVRVHADGYDLELIAGAFARRIHPYVEGGDAVTQGRRVGHIAFGSRVDVVCPPEVGPEDVAVDKGEAVSAGETVVVAGD
ncbi:MAG: phosphatidylserine decarboxylase [Halolamina sp.]